MPDIDIQPDNRHHKQRSTPAEKAAQAHRDRVLLTRLFAVMVLLTGCFSIVPPAMFWNRWSQQLDPAAIPRWVILQTFVAGMCVVYAVFLLQIADWSALKAVSVVMLVLAMAYGLISVSLLLGGGNGPIAQILHLEGATLDRATKWSAAMLCVTTLISYLGGREASKWQRTCQLVHRMSDATEN